jgi:hypothetical protein
MLKAEETFVLKLYLGEGKTSVIVPMLAVALANGKRMVRVVVLKPLLKMAQELLQSKLGGILNRTVHLLPFQRDFQPNIKNADLDKIRNTYIDCMNNRGVLITVPEYMLSFQLMGLERSKTNDSITAKKLLDTQQWLDQNACDILDESDEILSVKNQLIYTIGAQLPLDGGELRWTVIQNVLQYVKNHAQEFAEMYENDFEIQFSDHDCGSFPHVRVISSEVTPYNLLCREIMKDALKYLLPEVSTEYHDILITFTTEEDINESTIQAAKMILGTDTTAYNTL